MKDPVILWIMMGIFIWEKKKYHKNYLDVGEHSPTRMGLLSCRRIILVNFWFIFGPVGFCCQFTLLIHDFLANCYKFKVDTHSIITHQFAIKDMMPSNTIKLKGNK